MDTHKPKMLIRLVQCSTLFSVLRVYSGQCPGSEGRAAQMLSNFGQSRKLCVCVCVCVRVCVYVCVCDSFLTAWLLGSFQRHRCSRETSDMSFYMSSYMSFYLLSYMSVSSFPSVYYSLHPNYKVCMAHAHTTQSHTHSCKHRHAQTHTHMCNTLFIFAARCCWNTRARRWVCLR